MRQGIFIGTIRFILADLILDILYFPVWWYSKGLKKTGIFVVKQIKRRGERLALGILISHLFKPMYADYTRSGRIISFFARIIHLCFRLFLMIIWLILMVALFLLWLILPIFIIYNIRRIYQ